MQRVSRKTWIWIIASALFLGTAGYLYSNGAIGGGSAWLASLEGETTPLHIAVVIPEQAADSYPELEQVGRLFARFLYPAFTLIGGAFFLWLYTDPNAKMVIEMVRGTISG